MDSETLRQILLAVVAVLSSLWVLSSLLFRVGGTWERVLSSEERAQGVRPERIVLGQLGPFVTGRREINGGHQEFSGLVVGRTVRLNRRDHGVPSLMAVGFPQPIAEKLDGEVMAKLVLRVRKSSTQLDGVFIPQKVEFSRQPPRITERYFLDPQKRRYRRVVLADEPVALLRESTPSA